MKGPDRHLKVWVLSFYQQILLAILSHRIERFSHSLDLLLRSSLVSINSLCFYSYSLRYFSVSDRTCSFWSSSMLLFMDMNSLTASVLKTLRRCSSLTLKCQVSSSMYWRAWFGFFSRSFSPPSTFLQSVSTRVSPLGFTYLVYFVGLSDFTYLGSFYFYLVIGGSEMLEESRFYLKLGSSGSLEDSWEHCQRLDSSSMSPKSDSAISFLILTVDLYIQIIMGSIQTKSYKLYQFPQQIINKVGITPGGQQQRNSWDDLELSQRTLHPPLQGQFHPQPLVPQNNPPHPLPLLPQKLTKEQLIKIYKSSLENTSDAQQRLFHLFYHLDKGKKGYLNESDIQRLFLVFGKEVGLADIQSSFRYAKLAHNRLSFEDFKDHFYKL